VRLARLSLAATALLATLAAAPLAAAPAPAATPLPGLTEETLLEADLAAEALPRGEGVWAAFAHFAVPPGSRGRWAPSCCPGPLVEYVLAGAYAVRAEAPVRVVRAGGTEEAVPAGTEAVLGPGDGLVSRNEVAVEAANAGDGILELLSWALVDDPEGTLGGNTPDTPAVFGGHRLPDWSSDWVDRRSGPSGRFGVVVPAGPARLRLRQVELAPGASLPPPAGSSPFLVSLRRNAAGTPTDLVGTLGREADGTVLNRGREAFAVYVLTLEPAGGAGGAPASGTPVAPTA
jgi:quercetin dioxygenase-like cupin family protein